MAVELSITGWAGWAGAAINDATISTHIEVSPTPAVDNIPPMLRRRLNVFGRACANAIINHTHQGNTAPIVYCSRHGDIERTLSVLQELSVGNPVSPMAFSLAVHNAICGVASIHQQLTGNISTIAAEDGLIAVLLEAAALLNDGHNSVLCMIGDPLLPEIYQAQGTASCAPYVVCFLASREPTETTLRIQHSEMPAEQPHDYPALQFLAFLASSDKNLLLSHNSSRWAIAKI